MRQFFQYTHDELAENDGTPAGVGGRLKISADMFGMVTTAKDDMGIGQVLENVLPYFDYVDPMVYPSHYANAFMGFANPAEHPYEVIKYSMDTALARENTFLKQKQDLAAKALDELNTLVKNNAPAAEIQALPSIPVIVPLAKFRPWLQDFNMGADYTAEMVKSEIQATQDALKTDYTGFMLWNPSNIYNAY